MKKPKRIKLSVPKPKRVNLWAALIKEPCRLIKHSLSYCTVAQGENESPNERYVCYQLSETTKNSYIDILINKDPRLIDYKVTNKYVILILKTFTVIFLHKEAYEANSKRNPNNEANKGPKKPTKRKGR